MADGVYVSLAVERHTVDSGIDYPLLVLPYSLQLEEVPTAAQRAVRLHIESQDVLGTAVDDIEGLLVAAEQNPVGTGEVVRDQENLAGRLDVIDRMRANRPISGIGEIDPAVLPQGEVVGRGKGFAPIRIRHEFGVAGRVHDRDAYLAGTRPAAREDTAATVHRQGREAPPLAISVIDPAGVEQHGDVIVGVHTVDLVVRGLAEIQAAVRRGNRTFRAVQAALHQDDGRAAGHDSRDVRRGESSLAEQRRGRQGR